jgi:hypothetical protein
MEPVEPRRRTLLTPSGTMLSSLPKAAAATCRSVQRRTTANVLCPAFLPRPTIGWPQRASLPKLRTDRFQLGTTPIGIEFAYGAPVEPGEGASEKVGAAEPVAQPSVLLLPLHD